MWVGKKSESKAILVTDRGGLYGCEMSRILQFLDNRLRGGCKIVTLKHGPRSTAQKDLLAHISLRGCANPRAIVLLEELGRLKKFIHLVESRIHDVPVCNIVPQQLRYRVPQSVCKPSPCLCM
jgi:hypothetical protein